jgi:drug/metabolite transporter (DMT)-like permease
MPARPFPVASPLFLVLAGAVVISFSSVLVAASQVEPVTAGAYRVLVGGAALLAAALASGEPPPARPGIYGLALATAVIFAVDLSLWHTSIQGVGPGLATVLANFQVFVMAGVGAAFLGEKIRPRLVVAMVLALGGLGFLVGPGWFDLPASWKWGVVFGLLTAVAYSAYILVLRRMQSSADFRGQLWNMAIFSLFAGAVMSAEALAMGESLLVGAGSLGWLLLYGLLPHAVGWMFLSRGLPRVEISLAGVAILLQPSLAFVWDMVFFARPVAWYEVMGAGMAFMGIYLGVTRHRG